MVDAIESLGDEELSTEVEGYYNLSGMRLSQPTRGITIIRFKDGHTMKVRN